MSDMPTYTIYTLTDGIAEDIADTDNFDEALRFYDETVESERIAQARGDYAETTVHLYEPNWGIMHAGTRIHAQQTPTIRA